MDDYLRKKINLLVHLARVDGKFDKSEHEVMLTLLKEYGIEDAAYENFAEPIYPNDFVNTRKNADVLFWALRLIKADGEIHSDEASYCKALAVKLKYAPEIVEYFSNRDLGTKESFKKIAQTFSTASA